MSLENLKINEYEDSIKKLPNYPGDSGYSPDDLKAVFDARSDKEIKTAINGIIDVLGTKVNAEEGKQLSTNDYSDEERKKLSGIEEGAQVNTVLSVNGKSGEVTLTAADILSEDGEPVQKTVVMVEQLADAVIEIESNIGEIDTALAGIIAIQENMIGGENV